MTLTTGTHGATEAPTALQRIAAGVATDAESHDGVVLAAAIARATQAPDLMLVAIEPELPLVVPGADWRRMRRETKALLERTRDAFAPQARFAIDTDLSVARGLRRVIAVEHRQLLATGSDRHAPAGEVSIGRRTRQLLHELPCSLAIAPRGLSERPDFTLRRIGVGYDGGEEAEAALATASALATGSGAELVIRGVVDDRIPPLGWSAVWTGPIKESWEDAMEDEVNALRDRIARAAADLPVTVDAQVMRGRPGESLRTLTSELDLLVIGSRRWGPVARLLLGGTGETLAQGARCALLVVPRPHTGD